MGKFREFCATPVLAIAVIFTAVASWMTYLGMRISGLSKHEIDEYDLG